MRLFTFLAVVITFTIHPMLAAAQAEDPRDQIQWQFSTFLKGNTTQVRDIINGPLEQQLARKAEKQKRITDDKAVITTKADAAAVKLAAASPAFASLQTQLAAAELEVSKAKQTSDAVALIKAQDKAEKCRQDMAQQEEPVLSTDEEVSARRKEIAVTQTELRNLEPAIATATKARNQLVDGLRTTLKLPGPPAVGKKGLLGSVKPTKIIDAQSLLADFEAIEITGNDTKTKAADGFKSMTGKLHRCQLLVTGVDTTAMHVQTEVLLDRTFSITGTQKVGKITAYVVAPFAGEPRDQAFDYLFSKLDDIRKP
jgi:hypothetical protein